MILLWTFIQLILRILYRDIVYDVMQDLIADGNQDLGQDTRSDENIPSPLIHAFCNRNTTPLLDCYYSPCLVRKSISLETTTRRRCQWPFVKL